MPAAVVAGVALALANQLADLERDHAAGATTVATALGPERTWMAGVLFQGLLVAVAIVTLAVMRGWGAGLLAVVAGGVLVAIGLAVVRWRGLGCAELAWELQANGVGVLGSGWVAAMAEAHAF